MAAPTTFSCVVDTDDRLAVERFLGARLTAWKPTSVLDLLRTGCVRVADRVARPGRKLWRGDLIEVTFPPAAKVNGADGVPPLPILFEDEGLIVVDKPAGLAVEHEGVYPRAQAPKGRSVVTALVAQGIRAAVGGYAAPGVAHRLDTETSGVLALAKTDQGLDFLLRAFADKRTTKQYAALVLGAPPQSASLDTPYAKDPTDGRKWTTTVDSPKRARLSFTARRRFPTASELEVLLDTGRTHQIRVQLAEAGFPVLGDPTYGTTSPLIARQALHAERLTVVGEDGAIRLDVRAAPPSDYQRAATELC